MKIKIETAYRLMMGTLALIVLMYTCAVTSCTKTDYCPKMEEAAWVYQKIVSTNRCPPRNEWNIIYSRDTFIIDNKCSLDALRIKMIQQQEEYERSAPNEEILQLFIEVPAIKLYKIE